MHMGKSFSDYTGYKILGVKEVMDFIAHFFELLYELSLIVANDKDKTIQLSASGKDFVSRLHKSQAWYADELTVTLCAMMYCKEIVVDTKGNLCAGPNLIPFCPLETGEQGVGHHDGQTVDEHDCQTETSTPQTNKPTTSTSKLWTLIAPSGETIEVVNLKRWLEDNISYFGPPETISVDTVYKKFSEIARYMRRGQCRRASYKGWKIAALPTTQKTLGGMHESCSGPEMPK